MNRLVTLATTLCLSGALLGAHAPASQAAQPHSLTSAQVRVAADDAAGPRAGEGGVTRCYRAPRAATGESAGPQWCVSQAGVSDRAVAHATLTTLSVTFSPADQKAIRTGGVRKARALIDAASASVPFPASLFVSRAGHTLAGPVAHRVKTHGVCPARTPKLTASVNVLAGTTFGGVTVRCAR